ncbi:MAG: NUDIX hydrolase [Flavobacteriales bacterium]|nr:NUDIX hydrolase [Flavobacteriales bacterium]
MEERGPWKTLKAEERYATPWISVSHHEIIDPGGREGIYGVVHFRNLAVGIIPLDADGNTWIVGQYRYPINAYSWEIIEGGSPRDQPPIEGAVRELREEAGIMAEHWTEVLRMDLSNSASDEEAIIYVAQGLTFFEPEPDHNEQLEIRKLPFRELVAMVVRGELRDSLTVAGVLKVDCLLRDGSLTLQK